MSKVVRSRIDQSKENNKEDIRDIPSNVQKDIYQKIDDTVEGVKSITGSTKQAAVDASQTSQDAAKQEDI